MRIGLSIVRPTNSRRYMMTACDFMLSLEGQRRVRALLEADYEYVVHWGNAAALDRIRSDGLVPYTRGTDNRIKVATIAAAFCGEVPSILCLSLPVDPLNPMQPGPWIQLAVRTRDLPERVLLDWSFGVSWLLPDVLLDDGTCKEPERAILETFRRHRSIAVIAPIPASSLRIRLVGSAEQDPSEWPLLEHTPIDQVYWRAA